MGGHGHDHHHKPYTVPSADIYKVEEIPQLVRVQEALAKHGLKDPWLRNEVWRYDPKQFGTHASRARSFFLRGAKLGIPAFLVTIAVEHALGLGPNHGGHHGDHHSEHH